MKLHVCLSQLQKYCKLQPREIGVDWLTELCSGTVKEGCIPEDWKSSLLVPVYEGKGERLVCGSNA